MSVVTEFKEIVLRGNVIDLAVGVIVKPVDFLMSRRKTETPVAAATRKCPQCLSSIFVKATRCAFCTAEVAAYEVAAYKVAAV